MKVISRLLVVFFIAICACYYFEIDIREPINKLLGTNIRSVGETGSGTSDDADEGCAVIPDGGFGVGEDDRETYTEIMEFLISQGKDRKLIESYRVLEGSIGEELKGRSYIRDNALAVTAMINDGESTKNRAAYILENLALIQNENGSWYDVYDTEGQTLKISDKDYTECDTGNNAAVLYAYSYYTIMTGDKQFKDIMKKSASFVLSRWDDKEGGVHDGEISDNGSRTIRGNVYTYFGLREYAMTCIDYDYGEYKDKLFASDKVGQFILDDCIHENTFIKGYTGKDKKEGLDLDSHIMGILFLKASDRQGEIKYETKDLDEVLSKLYNKVSSIEGYRVDDSTESEGFIWCEGTCRVSLALLKLGDRDRCMDIIKYIEGYHEIVPANLTPRGIPQSTNVSSGTGMTDLESVPASAWAALAFQCINDDNINSVLFGNEEAVFKKMR